MRTTLTLLILLAHVNCNAQCPAPSNLIYTSINNGQDALLSWTENGTANTWEVAPAPGFPGMDIPSSGIVTTNNPFIIVAVPPDCVVFFLRSVCPPDDVSSWVVVVTGACSPDVLDYLDPLSAPSSSFSDIGVKLIPNPANDFIRITASRKIDKISVFDLLGKEMTTKTQNLNEVNIENLANGIYLVEISSGGKKQYKKFVKE